MKSNFKNQMVRNFKKEEEKELFYLGDRIVSWKEKWEQYDINREKWEVKQRIVCLLYRVNSKNQPLNLGECNDGSVFTAVNQAINQAKSYIDTCNKNGL